MKLQKLAVILLAMTTLTGCVKEYEYTQEQSDAVAEYAAGLLLKSDDSYKEGLMTLNQVVENKPESAAPTPVPESPAKGEKSAGDTVSSSEEGDKPQKQYSLTEVIAEKGFSLEFTDYVFVESYPEDPSETYFSITPRKGNQLIVLSFLLTNELKKDNHLNLTQADIKYQLHINSKAVYEPPFALLENNLKLIDIKLEKKEAKPVVLIFEVEKNVKITDLSLKVSREDRSMTVDIK